MYLPNASVTNHYLRKCLYDKHAQYSLGMCNFPLKGWRPLGCAMFFFWWVKQFLQFNGIPFQINCNWASSTGVSYSFRRIGATFKHKGQLRQFSFWCEAFPSNEWDVFSKERTLQRNGATFHSTAGFVWKSVTLLSFKEMLEPRTKSSHCVSLDLGFRLYRYVPVQPATNSA